MLLRLPELPPEYTVGSGSGCGVLGPEIETTQTVADFAARYRPVACQFEYQRRFVLPGQAPAPPLVESFAFGTRTAPAAEAGFGIAGDLLREYVGDPGLTEVPGAAPVGDEARLFHTTRAFVAGRSGQPGSALFWRSGNTLAALYIAGMPIAVGDGVVLQLAQVQQRHVESPTPYTKAEQDDTLVPFENPAIRLPVYWLGPTFRPGHGLPPSPLRDALLPIPAGSAPGGVKAQLSYDGITIETWTAAGWRRREKTPDAELVRRWHCTEVTRASLPRGEAIVYAGYPEDFAECPKRPPNVFLAEVHTGGLVIGIDVPGCELCIEARRGPYHSRRDMKIIARALRVRSPGS